MHKHLYSLKATEVVIMLSQSDKPSYTWSERTRKNPGRAWREKDGSVGEFVCKIMKRCTLAQKGATQRLDLLSFEVIKS